MTLLLRQRLLASTLLIGAASLAAPAYGQGVPQNPDEAPSAQTPAQEIAEQPEGVLTEPGEEGEIIVTGSRIRRTDLTASSPVAVATAAEISSSGEIANVENFLNELPQFVPFTTAASNNPGNGLAVVDLRSAGPNRTLVLVDGKRFVPSTLGGIIDLNNIPTPLVQRVEVVTGGASAVYGSDALAGVVNFILKDDFSGLEANAFYRITERGDSPIYTLSATIGGNFDDDKGNAALFVGYTERKPSFAADRLYSRTVLLDSVPALNARGVPIGGCVPGSQNRFGLGTRSPAGTPLSDRETCFVAGGSSGVPGTLFFDIGQVINPDGTPRPFVNPDDLYNFAPPNYLQIPQERWIGTGVAHYEISPAVVPFGRFTFAYNRVPTQLAPTPIFDSFDFNLDNPFITPALRARLAPLATDGIVNTFIGRRNIEGGPRTNPQENYSFQAQGGVRGEVLRDLNYEAFYSYGRTASSEQLGGDVSRTRFQQALRARRDANGNIVCVDPSNGCVPANIFGPNNISQDSVDFFELSAQSQTLVRTQEVGATIGGPLPLTLFHEERVGFALGVEYRSINGRFDPDEALQREVLGFNRTSPTAGGFNVKEAFGEVSIPLIGGKSFIHDLRFTGAARVSNYSTIGTVYTYSAGAEFAPTRDIRFRGQYQRAVRAPNIGELFAGQGNSFPSAVDVCSNQQPTNQRTEAIRAACVRSGVPADRVFAFTPPGGTQVETLIGGNPDLFEETSDTYTVGAVFTPRFLRGFNATVDYYNIRIEDIIATFGGGTANIISTCFTIVGGDPSSPFCQAIVRRPNSTIDFVRGTAANVSTLKLEGVDFQVDYRSALPFNIFDDDTAAAIIIRGTRTLKSELQADAVSALVDCVELYGTRCGNPTPKWRVNTQLSLSSGPVGVNFQHRYMSQTFDARQVVFANPVRDIDRSFTRIDRPSSKIDDYHIFDASVNFDINERYQLLLGVDNLFDRDPPVPGDSADEQNNTYPSAFDPLGRKYFVSVRVRL
jgi:outer membrane receptor protein involved in Fe transport